MIDRLTVINLKANANIRPTNGEVFVLKTCQRSLIIGFGHLPYHYVDSNESIKEVFTGSDASVFLLETICGLKSSVLAEYEVVNQFREAYQTYNTLPEKNAYILQTMEKLFQDAKKVRTEHLMEIGQLTYAGIARKLIHKSGAAESVLILGSGVLAEDLIKLLKKKTRIFISARNTAKVEELAKTYDLKIIPFKETSSYEMFPLIVNTIGTSEVLFDETFFSRWMHLHIPNQLFIDLGSPSVINTSLTEAQGVMRLEDIFKQSTQLNEEKTCKVLKAKEAISLLVKNRFSHFTLNYPYGWEELQFA
jgi:glutamyl-tRNA reductase